ncbi:MAG: hypothetical protein PHU46_12005 [Rhodocyclaceae bacterium]|nr:hypothetical protein [Rhodocyclaceae bacterium]
MSEKPNPSQYIFRLLEKRETMSAGAIAKHLGLRAEVVLEALDRLVEAGMVFKNPDKYGTTGFTCTDPRIPVIAPKRAPQGPTPEDVLALIKRRGRLGGEEIADQLNAPIRDIRTLIAALIADEEIERFKVGRDAFFRIPVPDRMDDVGEIADGAYAIAQPRQLPVLSLWPALRPTPEQLARIGPDGKARRLGA